MDFLKTLLIYMTATMTMAVESTAVPQITATPAPTLTPAVVETVTAAPSVRIESTATPSPTPAPSPEPVPAITPNKHYKNLKQGSRGSEVKKLQQRLIELGYLSEGEADGAYGGKTRNAVRKFQYYNGLQQDGIAGDMTQTYLYENPDVAANPSMTAAPSETAAAELKEAEPEEAPKTGPEEETEVRPETEKTEEPVPGEETEAGPEKENPLEAEKAAPESNPGKLQPLEGSVVLNDAGAPMQMIVLEDGVNVAIRPRLWRAGETVYVSLEDLADCCEEWLLSLDDGQMILEAEGYVLAVTRDENAPLVTVDGAEIALAAEDLLPDEEGYPVSSVFLKKTLKANVLWDEEEATLMLRVLPKAAANASD